MKQRAFEENIDSAGGGGGGGGGFHSRRGFQNSFHTVKFYDVLRASVVVETVNVLSYNCQFSPLRL